MNCNARAGIPRRIILFIGGDCIQTILVVQSAAAGAIYINGRMAGEVDAERPLTLPVSPFGALILELRPFPAGYLPLALRIPLSHGAPLIHQADPRFFAALWPGGVLEIELIPERLPATSQPRFLSQLGDMRLFLSEGASPSVRCEFSSAAYVHPLPELALPPAASAIPGGIFLVGDRTCDDQYALILSPDASTVLLSVTGKNISLLDGGAALRLLHPLGDTVGHAALETWAVTPQGWQLAASEPMWERGAPVRPETPEAAAIAAVESAQLGLSSEAAAYFAPAVSCADILAQAASYDGCVPLRYPLPGGESAVGLMQLRGNVLHIVPARYAARPGGLNGAYQLTKLEIG